MVSASPALLEKVYGLLQELDPLPVQEKKEEEKLRALYFPKYAPPEALLQTVKGQFPELKADLQEKALLLEGNPGATRQALEVLAQQDRPKAQAVYRLTVFELKGEQQQAFEASLLLALRNLLSLGLGSLLDLQGCLPPDPNLSNGLRGALRAAESKGWGRTLVDTTIVASDGEEAKMQVGGRVSILASPGSTGAGGGQGGTQGQGQASPSPINYDYGLILKVTPKVQPRGVVETTLSLEMANEPVVSDGTVRYPTKKLEGRYLVSQGQVIAIGGVVSAEERQGRNGVPVLMDIPLLGSLFGKSETAKTSNKLLIYLTLQEIANPPAEPGEVKYLPSNPPETPPSSPPPRVPPWQGKGEGNASRPQEERTSPGVSGGLPAPGEAKLLRGRLIPSGGGTLFVPSGPESLALLRGATGLLDPAARASYRIQEPVKGWVVFAGSVARRQGLLAPHGRGQDGRDLRRVAPRGR